MIEIKNLYKRYHNHHSNEWVLKDINIIIPPGISVGLIGANGAGKSTLLRLIAGMDSPDKGEVIRHSRVSWPVGLTGGMQGSLTGRQNVKFVARAQGRRKEVHDIVNFVEDFAEIGNSFDDPVKTYSSGMKSRLAFGLSLAFKFEVYLSDEATSVGDKNFKIKAKEYFRDRIDESSIIMVSHTEDTLREFCDAGILLVDGQATWFDNLNDAISLYNEIEDNKRNKHRVHLNEDDKSEELKRKLNKLQDTMSGIELLLKNKSYDFDKADILEDINSRIRLQEQDLINKLSSTSSGYDYILDKEVILKRKILRALKYINSESFICGPEYSKELVRLIRVYQDDVQRLKILKDGL